MKPPTPLRRYLSLQFATVAALPVVIIAILAWLFVLPRLQTSIALQQQSLARTIAGQISTYLMGGQRQLGTLADLLGSGGTTDAVRVTALLDAHCGDGDLFETIFTIASGETRIQRVGLAKRRRAGRDDLLDLDLSGRGFLERGRQSGRVFWSETFLSTVSGHMAVAVIVPMKGGVIVGEITLQRITDFIRHLPAEAGLLILVLDGQGRVVADSQGVRSGQAMDLARLPDIRPDGAATASHPFRIEGQSLVGTMVGVDQLTWKVLVGQPVERAFQTVRDTFRLLALGLAVTMVIALTIAWQRAGNLSRLVRYYAGQASAIARGNYALNWVPSRTLEFQHLTENLQSMAQTIRRREDQLMASETHLRITLDSIGDGVIATDRHGRVTQINPMAERLTGRSQSEALGQALGDIFQIIDADTRRSLPDPVAPVLTDGENEAPNGRAVLVSRDGREYHVAHSAAPIRYPDGQVAGGVRVFRDITTSYLQEREIRENEKELKKLLTNVPGVVYQYVTRPEGHDKGVFLSIDQEKIWDLLGLRVENDRLFDAFADCLPPEERERFDASTREAIQAVKAWDFEGRFIKPTGEEIWVSGRSVPHRVGDDIVQYGVLMDITRRKRLEESLRLTQFCFDKASIGIFQIGDGGRILNVNEQGCASLGYSLEALRRMTVFDIDTMFVPDAWPSHMAVLQRDKYLTITSRHRHQSGRTFPVQSMINLMTFEGREFHVWFVQDISERTRWEAELAASEHRYRSLFNEAPMMYVVTDNRQDEPYIKDVNRRFLSLLDYRREEVLGTPLSRYYTAAARRQLFDEGGYHRALSGGFVTTERELVTRDNRIVHTLLHSLPDVDADGRVIGTRAMYLDITDRKQAIEELQQLRNYLSNIIDSMPSILVGVDTEGRVTQWNRQAELATGIRFKEARGLPLANVFPRLESEMDRVRQAIREREAIRKAKIPRQIDGATRFEDVTIYPLVANGVEGAVIRIDDVTERVRLEEMMIQSEKMLSVGGLAAGMAHEINNPLAGILQNAIVLENRLLGDMPANVRAAEAAGTTMAAIRRYLAERKLAGMLENIRTSGNRAAEIVRNMLSFARKSDRMISSHDLGDLLDQTVALVKTDYDMKKHYDFKHVEVFREYDQPPVCVPCEASKIQQVFLNILKNGAEAMAETSGERKVPRFILRVKNEDQAVRVEIEDNGPGMDEMTRRRIFEPFFTTKPVGKGTGLGLSVSYFIITEDHGGEMSAHGVADGGTRFVIRLPKAGKGAV